MDIEKKMSVLERRNHELREQYEALSEDYARMQNDRQASLIEAKELIKRLAEIEAEWGALLTDLRSRYTECCILRDTLKNAISEIKHCRK